MGLIESVGFVQSLFAEVRQELDRTSDRRTVIDVQDHQVTTRPIARPGAAASNPMRRLRGQPIRAGEDVLVLRAIDQDYVLGSLQVAGEIVPRYYSADEVDRILAADRSTSAAELAAEAAKRTAKRLGTQQSIGSASTFVVPDIFVPMLPGETWIFDWWLSSFSSTGGGVRFSIDGPPGASVVAHLVGSTTAATTFNHIKQSSITGIPLAMAFGAYTTVNGSIRITGSAICGATPGNLFLSWNRAVTGDTVNLDAGSTLHAERTN